MEIEEIKRLSSEYFEPARTFRRYLHAHPELSFKESGTSNYISTVLKNLGVSHTTGLAGGTGILAEIGKGPLKLALRADIDALPIDEENEIPYKSLNPGVMHACGHDVHTAILLGVVHVLKAIEHKLEFSLRFIFQPGEERLPGGASMMIREGALQNVPLILAEHVHPELPVGKVGYRSGFFMASCDEIFIDVIGKGGHGASPHRCIDPVVTSASIIQALQHVQSRNSNPLIPGVLSIGKIYSHGGATNVIPDKVSMEGTFRTFDSTWREEAHKIISKIIHDTASSHGARAVLRIEKGYPSLYNDPVLTERCRELMTDILGPDNVIELDPRMGAEDFSYYSREIPSCFYRLGTASKEGGNSNPVHTPHFDIDESALETGILLMSWLALRL